MAQCITCETTTVSKKEKITENTASTCVECGKTVKNGEGFVSSSGDVVCGKECMKSFTQKLPNQGKASLISYSRVTGYLSPVQAWNKGKKKEFQDRVKYDLGGVIR